MHPREQLRQARLPPGALGRRSDVISPVEVSTITDTNQRPAWDETVARFSWPVNRTVSRIRTQPMAGSLIRSPSARNAPASLAVQKLCRSSFRLKRGYRLRLSKKDRKALPRSTIASCTAALVTSYIHRNCSRFTALRLRRSEVSFARSAPCIAAAIRPAPSSRPSAQCRKHAQNIDAVPRSGRARSYVPEASRSPRIRSLSPAASPPASTCSASRPAGSALPYLEPIAGRSSLPRPMILPTS
jgi:hypothetical protein